MEAAIALLSELGWRPAGTTPVYWQTFRYKSVRFGGRLRFKYGSRHTCSVGPRITCFYQRKKYNPDFPCVRIKTNELTKCSACISSQLSRAIG